MNLKQFELKANKSEFKKAKITRSSESVEYIRQFYGDDIEIYESCFILLLNKANTTIGYAKISQGGICGTVVDTRLVCKYAIESLCSSVILCHNHPSGNTQPSNADNKITQQIKEGLKLFDIVMLDHVILTESSYYSYADEGNL